MHARGALRGALRILFGVLTLPATLLHEAAHAAAASPWATQAAVVVHTRPALSASAAVEWRDDTPGWALILAHYAPLGLGVCIGVTALVLWTVGGYSPGTHNLAIDAALAVWWVIFTLDSPADRELPQAGAEGDPA